MGDIAEDCLQDIFDQMMFDDDYPDQGFRPLTCRFCGKRDLDWEWDPRSKKWVLYDNTPRRHARKTLDRMRVVAADFEDLD